MSNTVFESELKHSISQCAKSIVSYDHLDTIENRIAFCSGYFSEDYPYLSELLETILLNKIVDIPF